MIFPIAVHLALSCITITSFFHFVFVLSFDNSHMFVEFQIIQTVRKHILTGGRKRLPYTVPPLIFSSLKVFPLFCYSNQFVFELDPL